MSLSRWRRPARRGAAGLIGLLLTLLWAGPLWAHPVELGVLRVVEDAPGQAVATLTFSGTEERPGKVAPVIVGCARSQDAGELARMAVFACEGGLDGRVVEVEGLAGRDGEVVIELVRADGSTSVAMVDGDLPRYTIPERPSAAAAFGRYALLGAEHVLAGFDHLLFVLGLVFLVGARRRLLLVVTAFTLGHSVTLALAALGVITVPLAPVEATIAASLLPIAVAVVKRARQAGLDDVRQPDARWLPLMTMAFGLLHGLGFAAALSEVGLPPSQSWAALAGFNVGVEAGQLAFILTLLLAMGSAALLASRLARWIGGRLSQQVAAWRGWAPKLVGYSMGSVATFWYLDRLAVMLGA